MAVPTRSRFTASRFAPLAWLTFAHGLPMVGLTGGCDAEEPGRIPWLDPYVGTTTTTASVEELDLDASTTGAETSDDGSGSDGEGETEADPVPLPPPYVPARYPGGQTHSPITPYVADRMREIALLGPDNADDVFMKTGASTTVSSRTLHCFADGPMSLGERTDLQPALEHFLGGDAAGASPFNRDTEAARGGHHAGWAISGDPSPIDIEADLLSPSLALVHFGTNDMGWGETYGDALLYFHENMMVMLDGFIDRGLVPIVFGITRRGDYASAQRWVGTWNATLRAIAQSRQVPFIDVYHAIDPLPGHGLAGDGLHLESYSEGACILDAEGLGHGYNIRNLIALEALDRAAKVLVDDEPGLDAPNGPLAGAGTPDAPWTIEGLPFTDVRNTAEQGASFVDHYPGCDSDADESGPELWYRLEIEQTTRIRAAVLDMEGVDIDVHLVGPEATGEGCLERGHHFVQTTLEPGIYHFALDTWVSDGTPRAGEFIFVLVECDDGDPSCNA